MTTMTAEDLRSLITPAVEADLKAAGLWPTRESGTLFCNDPHPIWFWRICESTYERCHHDDAHAQIERRLVEWALSEGSAFNKDTNPQSREPDKLYIVICHLVYEHGTAHLCYYGPTLLHALIAAFAGRSKT